jgi:hypothetical protein
LVISSLGIELRPLKARPGSSKQTPAQSVMPLDAVPRPVWRMCVSHRRLMEWTTAAGAIGVAQEFFIVFVHSRRSVAAVR